MIDQDRIKTAAIATELAVQHAKKAGYSIADCVLTPEVQDLIQRIKPGP